MKITELVKQNSLVWTNQKDVVVDSSHSNIFLGGGVATKTQISKCVPFDLLGFMLTAEQVKRISGGQVHILIADQHAWLANQLDQTEATMAASNLQLTAERIIAAGQFAHWHIHLASTIFKDATPANYEVLETRDVGHFFKHFSCGIKIGWTFSMNETGITDESHFDMLHSMKTILIKPGLTDDQTKPHESPYICTNPSSRMTFSKSNPEVVSNAVTNHLRDICRLWESVVTPFPQKTPLATKIQIIIDRIEKE